MAFVPKQTPDCSAYGRVVAIIAPSSSHAPPPTSRFERFQGFHREERAAMDGTQQEQDVAGQMSERSITAFILAPTAIDLPTVGRKLLVEPKVFGIIGGKLVSLLFIPGNLLLEFLNLSAGACLSAIKATRVEKYRSAHLLVVFIHGGCLYKR